MGISEAERRVKELAALITNQLRLIRKLEKRGRDLTSAKIVFDSLRVSLFLATQDWHRARCFSAPDQNGANQAPLTWGFKTSLAVVPHTERLMARWTGREASMQPVHDLLDIAEGTKELKEGRDTSIVPETEVEQKNDSSQRDFGFRPLTEDEKKQFVNSLNDDGKRILAQLAGEAKAHTGESAA
jgi:hypothetical protein